MYWYIKYYHKIKLLSWLMFQAGQRARPHDNESGFTRGRTRVSLSFVPSFRSKVIENLYFQDTLHLLLIL